MSETDDPPANDNVVPGRKCPICGKPTQLRYKPFCSKRCADIDLNRWLTGSYAIPGGSDDKSSDDER